MFEQHLRNTEHNRGGTEQYWYIHSIAAAYTAAMACFSASAWLGEGSAFQAAACVGAQLIAVACALLCRRALTARMWLSAIASAVFATGCAYWAALGLQHAWEANSAPVGLPMIIFLAALEPALFLLAEHIKQGREAVRTANPPNSTRLASLALGAAVASALSPAWAHSGANATAIHSQQPMIERRQAFDGAREKAIALAKANPSWTQERIALHAGAKRSTVGKWLRDAQTMSERLRA